MLLFPVRLHAFQQISTPTGGDLNDTYWAGASVREIGGSTGGASGMASNFRGMAMAPSAPPWGHHCIIMAMDTCKHANPT